MSLAPRNNLFDIDRFFNDSRPLAVESQTGTFSALRVDIKDVDVHYEITAELHGVAKEDIHVHVHVKDGILTLEASKLVEKLIERRRIEID